MNRPGRWPVVVFGCASLACALVGVWSIVQRRAVDARRRQQTSDVRTQLKSAVDQEVNRLVQQAGAAAALPPLQAALRDDVDAATLLDLFETEDWWEPFRKHASGVVRGKTVLSARGLPADVLGALPLVPAARAGRSATGAIPVVPPVIAAAVPLFIGASKEAVLVLAVPIERDLFPVLARGGGAALLLSDGVRPFASTGEESLKAQAETLIGHENDAAMVVPESMVAAAIDLGSGLWLWTVHKSDAPWRPSVPLQSSLFTAAIVFVVAAMVFARSGRRSRREQSQEEDDSSDELVPASSVAPVPASSFAAPRPSTSVPSSRVAAPPLVSHTQPPVGVAPASGSGQATMMAPDQEQVFGRYTLVERIGSGGMAEIYLATVSGAEGFQRPYVVKRLKPELAMNKAAVAQFIDEARLGSLLSHSNVVQIHDFGKIGDGYFLAAEYVNGRNLNEIATRARERTGVPIPLPLVLHIAHEVLQGLAYAHERADDTGQPLRIVHRDVSPTNIMVTEQGDVKLIDFGIAKADVRVSQTEQGNVKGNVNYMSPEHARGQVVDARTDLFSLGLVVFDVVSPEPFYRATTTGEILYQAATGPTVDHASRVAKLREPLASLLPRALALDPAARFPSARAFSESLAPHVGGMKLQLAAFMRHLYGDELKRSTTTGVRNVAGLASAIIRAGNIEP